MTTKWTETQTSFARFRADGIFEVRMKDGSVENLSMAKSNTELGSVLIGDSIPAPMLLVCGGMLELTSDARAYYSESRQAHHNVSRLAIVMDSYVSRVIGNLFIGIGKPAMPVKLFTGEDKAIAWLKQT